MMRKFKVVKDHGGINNNWNQPQRVELKVGDILTAVDKCATSRGHFFCKLNDTEKSVHSYSINARCPNDPNPNIDTEYLEEIL